MTPLLHDVFDEFFAHWGCLRERCGDDPAPVNTKEIIRATENRRKSIEGPPTASATGHALCLSAAHPPVGNAAGRLLAH